MTNLTVISPPAGEALSLAEAKEYLRIGHEGEDDLVSGLIESARARLEVASGFALITRTLQGAWRQWPVGILGRGAVLRPGPVSALTSITLVESSGARSDITEHFHLNCGRLCLKRGSILPRLSNGRTAEVVFQTGYGGPEDVPADLVLCVKRLVQQAYARGTSADEGLPPDVTEILVRRREVRL